jgi:hypothetical protein
VYLITSGYPYLSGGQRQPTLERFSSQFVRRGREIITSRSQSSKNQLFEYGVLRPGSSDVVVMHGDGLQLLGAAQPEADTNRLLEVGRAWMSGGPCEGCVRTPHGSDRRVTGGGCSVPGNAPEADVSVSPRALSPRIRWDSEFPLVDRTRQLYQVNDAWALQPGCAEGSLSSLRITWSPANSLVVEVPPPAQAPGRDDAALRDALRRIERVIPLGVTEPIALQGHPLSGVPVEWPAHGYFRHGVLAGWASGHPTAHLTTFDIYFYRLISGVVEDRRGPVSADRRAAVKIGGQWYWTTLEILSTLRVGQRATNIAAAGPDTGRRLQHPPSCVVTDGNPPPAKPR